MSKIIFALTLMGLMAVAFAGKNDDRPDMSDGTKRQCQVAFETYGACERRGEGRKCFLDLLNKRFDRLSAKSNDRLKAGDFLEEVDEVYEWCDDNKGDAVQCTLKKIKKDACRWYFREQKATDEVLEVVEKLGL